ncbi:MAG TPA: 50S ribosomal protein L11 [Haliangium sp.]|nr:50S ribosomal protein L11 [Haliangium sp.]
MAKKVTAVVKLILEGGKATPSQPVGPALGPYGVNMMAFVNEYNKRTAQHAGLQVPVLVSIYADRSMTLDVKQPTTSSMLRKAAGVDKGSTEPKRTMVGQITRRQITEMAQVKMADLNTNDVEAAARIIAGTARSMGLSVVD